jgi:hypothetical protein
MIRRTAALILALTLNQALLRAQDVVLTVNVPSADVYKGPSTVTPVIGHVSRGTVLPISRNLGSWVKIAWPDAPDGIAYVHVTMGRIGPPAAAARVSAATAASASPESAPEPVTRTIPMRTRTSVGEQVVPRGQLHLTPASHIIGVGALIAPMTTFGATARAWHDNRLGVQFGFTRESMTSDGAAGRVTSVQFEPGVVYALFDHVGDYVWMRPYIGSAIGFRQQTWHAGTPVAVEPASDNSVGFRVFAGTELTFASMPRFGVSADVGYRRFPTPFAGFESESINLALAGHWYVK